MLGSSQKETCNVYCVCDKHIKNLNASLHAWSGGSLSGPAGMSELVGLEQFVCMCIVVMLILGVWDQG